MSKVLRYWWLDLPRVAFLNRSCRLLLQGEAVESCCSRPPVFPTLLLWNSQGEWSSGTQHPVTLVSITVKAGYNLGTVVIACALKSTERELYSTVDRYHEALNRSKVVAFKPSGEAANSCEMDLDQD